MRRHALPTIAVLHMTVPTWTGRTENTTPHTDELTLISVDPVQAQADGPGRATVVHRQRGLPYNALRLAECAPLPGLLLLTAVSVMYVSTTSAPSFALPFNPYSVAPPALRGVRSVFREHALQTTVMQHVDGLHRVTERLYLLFTTAGESFYVHLLVAGGGVTEVFLSRAPFRFRPTCVCLCGDVAFFGSTVHDSLLYAYRVVEYGTSPAQAASAHVDQEVRSKTLLGARGGCAGYPFCAGDAALRPQEVALSVPEAGRIATVSCVHDYCLVDAGSHAELAYCCGFQPFGRVLRLTVCAPRLTPSARSFPRRPRRARTRRSLRRGPRPSR